MRELTEQARRLQEMLRTGHAPPEQMTVTLTAAPADDYRKLDV